jgi:predicted  nucleic acid-binding Zn-ribbon protein
VGVSGLFRLQHIDLEIARLQAHRAGLSDGAPERAAASEAARRLSHLRDEIAIRQSRLRTLDLELQSLQAKRKKVEGDLYSGRIGNPKELTAMQEELAALDRAKTHLEDEVLGLLDEVERLEPQERDAQAQVAAAEGALQQQVAAYQQATAAADQDLQRLAMQRSEAVSALDEDLLRRYERLREAKGGLAIVAVRGGICEACHITIPERFRRRLEDNPETLAACDGCGRLLFVPR